jgi:hypothetical protein
MEPNELMTRERLGSRWGVHTKTIDRLRKEGRLPWMDLAAGKGSRPIVRFRLSDVEHYEQGNLLQAPQARE